MIILPYLRGKNKFSFMSKGNHNFYIKSTTNKKGESGIYLINSFHGKRFKYGIGETIPPELWDKEAQRPTSDKGIIREFNNNSYPAKTKIKEVEKRISQVIDIIDNYEEEQKKLKQIIAFEDLRNRLDNNIRKVDEGNQEPENEKIKFILEYVSLFLEGITTGKITIADGNRQGQRYSEGTIKNYKGFKTQFENFEKKTSKNYTWDEIDLKFYKKFVAFFNDKDYKKNTIGRHIKNLKVIMDAARVEGLHNNLKYREKGFKTLKAETTEIFLTEDEIKKINNLDLSKNVRLEKIRDVFILGCLTGQRFSDVLRISERNIKDDFIILTQKKTKQQAFIPLTVDIKSILEKYNFRVPTVYEQKVNYEIKDICKDLEINESIPVSIIKGGDEKTEWIPKYKLVKTHTGRRSAITNMYLKGFDMITIMSVSGHKKESEVLKYIRATPLQKAERLKAQREMFEFMRNHNLKNIES